MDVDYKESATEYDKQVKEYDSYSHDVIFGMCFEYVKPNDKLLDLGIGTGLSSIHFSNIGLKVYGLDRDEDMLNRCRSKSFAVELKQHDLTQNQIPYPDKFFNHIVCGGVLHFIDDLEQLFSEITRVTTKGSIFAFTFAPNPKDEDYTKQDTAWGVPIFTHSPTYIYNLLKFNSIKLLKEQRLLMKGADKINYDMLFSVMVTQIQ